MKKSACDETFERIKLEMIMKIHRVSKKKAKEMQTSTQGLAFAALTPADDELISAVELFGD